MIEFEGASIRLTNGSVYDVVWDEQGDTNQPQWKVVKNGKVVYEDWFLDAALQEALSYAEDEVYGDSA